MPDARGQEVRRALLGILTRANLLAGRLSFFDLHESFQARAHLDLAREAAGEAGSPLLSAVVLGHLAFLPAEKHNFPATASYLAGARDSLSRQPASLVAAWISAIESEMTTKNAATSQALRCLERAKAELARHRACRFRSGSISSTSPGCGASRASPCAERATSMGLGHASQAGPGPGRQTTPKRAQPSPARGTPAPG